MYLCICKAVSDTQIRQAVEQGACTVADLNLRLGIGFECGRCLDSVREWLDVCLAALSPAVVGATPCPEPVNTPSPVVSVAAAPARAAWFMIDP